MPNSCRECNKAKLNDKLVFCKPLGNCLMSFPNEIHPLCPKKTKVEVEKELINV